MAIKRVNSGLFISLVLHTFLMVVPVTVTGVREFKEIEFFVVQGEPVAKEKKVMERPKEVSVSSVIEPEVVKKPNPLFRLPLAEEKKTKNETTMAPKKYDVETPPEEESWPVSQSPLSSIPNKAEEKDAADKPRNEMSETIRSPVDTARMPLVNERKLEDVMVPQTIPLKPPPIPERQYDGNEKTHEENPGLLAKSSIGKESLPFQQESYAGDQGTKTASKPTHLPLDEKSFVSGEGPRFLRRQMPVYPQIARRLGKEGNVLLRLTIDEKGNLLNVEVIEKAGYGFTEAAVEAVKKSAFLPAKKDGKPIPCRAILPVKFQLKRE